MAFYGKEYKLEKEENFEGFLKSVGIPDEKIKGFLSFTSTQKMEKDGDSYTLTMTTPDGAKKVVFQSGVEVDEVMGDGDTVKSTYTVDGNTVTQLIKNKEGVATFKKEYNGDELVVTITSSNWDGVARRYYKA